MKPHVFVFFPHNPYPPASGAHQRCLEVLRVLIDLDCEVTFLSATNSSDTPWEQASIDWLEGMGVAAVHVYRSPRWNSRLKAMLAKAYWMVNRRTGISRPIAVDSPWFTPPGMRRWFTHIVRQAKPDIMVMNYAHWDGLLQEVRARFRIRIIDTHDLVSLNSAMRLVLAPRLAQPLVVENVPAAIVQEDFFAQQGVKASPDEFAVYDRYDYTLAISPGEATIIAAHAPKTKVVLAPMTQPIPPLGNTYAAPPLFAAGATPLNLQGYLYLVKRVMPRVLREVPGFSLHVTGTIAKLLPATPENGIVIRGFVPSIADVYATAGYAICPVLGRTGQQIKIVEAMAHGLPVVALSNTAAGSPLKHGVNGFIAEDADSFARYLIELWHDRALCRRLGEAARATIATEHSSTHMRDLLSKLILPPP